MKCLRIFVAWSRANPPRAGSDHCKPVSSNHYRVDWVISILWWDQYYKKRQFIIFRYILVKFLHKYLFVDAIFFLQISEVSTCCSKATGSCRTVCEKVRHYIFNKNKTGLLKFQIWIQNEYIMQHFVLFSFWNVPFSFGSLCSVSVYFYSALVNLFSLQHFYTVDKFSYF